MEPLLDALTAALGPYLGVPFAFFGHSLGATICYELAQRLRLEGRNGPVQLLVAARRAPHVPSVDTPVYNLSDAEFRRRLRELGGTPDDVLDDAELMEVIEPMLRADFEVNDTYGPSDNPPLDCPISAFGASHDRAVPREHLEAWREATRVSFRLNMIPGDHFSIMGEQAGLVEGVARELQLILKGR